MRSVSGILVITVLLLWMHCSNSVDGGGTEITGRMVTADALPAENATVKLINPVVRDTFISTTDHYGNYRFTGEIPEGRYTLQGTKDSLACIIFDLKFEMPYADRVDTLRRTGYVYSMVQLDNSVNRGGIEVYIPGTSFYGKSDNAGIVTLSNVPPGDYPVLFEKHGFQTGRDSAHVLSGRIDTIGPVTLALDPSVPVELPVPTHLTAVADTFTGTVTLTWDSIVHPIGGYYLRTFDTLVHQDPRDVNWIFCGRATYTDTKIFTEKSLDTIREAFRVYQVRAVDVNDNPGQWGERCSLTIKKPVVPPPPSFTLSLSSESSSVAVAVASPAAWWVDSVFIYRSVQGGEPVCAATLPFHDDVIWNDRVGTIPAVSDSVIPIVYTLYAKSMYGFLSGSSDAKTVCLANPYLRYTLPAPPKPRGLRPEEDAARYRIIIPVVASPLQGDTIHYRLRITDNSGDSPLFTAWYTIPIIDVSLLEDKKYYLQSQVQSRHLPGLVSPLSDTLAVKIHQTHSAPTPSTPVGETTVARLNPYSYISSIGDTCSNGHPVAIHYVVAYQSESASDSTSWLVTPNNSATIIWSKPGIAFLRAQARCSTDPAIISPWSDALVVEVK